MRQDETDRATLVLPGTPEVRILETGTTERGVAMARRSIEQRLQQIEAQRKALKARLGKQDRARDTRRKILLGALILHRLETRADAALAGTLPEWLRTELPGFLTRAEDKALFRDLLEEAGPEPEHPSPGSNSPRDPSGT